jgi:hypothetical protein
MQKTQKMSVFNHSNQPHRTTFNGVRYDSNFEALVAEKIQPLVYRGWSIKGQFKITVKPATASFPARNWRCDFALKKNDTLIFLEAKGFVDQRFQPILEMFEYYDSPNFERLLIVVPDSFKVPNGWKNLKIIKFSALSDYLLNL